ncbi:MAG: hypothetical protein ACON4J_03780 [Parvibaculales bacterium]
MTNKQTNNQTDRLTDSGIKKDSKAKLSGMIAAYGSRQTAWPKTIPADTLSDMLRDTDLTARLQDAQRLDQALDRLSFAAPAGLEHRILSAIYGDMPPAMIINASMRSRYTGYALMAMAACLLIGIFAQPIAQSFFDYAQAALTGQTPDLFMVDFETWKI